MAQLRRDFQGRGEVETCSWTCVQAMSNGVQLSLGVSRQVRSLGQVLAQQPIRILVGPPFPRRMRIGKEHLNLEVLRQALVFGHLFPPIVRQGFPQQGGHMPEFLAETLPGTPRTRPLHPGQDDHARRPLHQRPNRHPIAGALEEIAFPVARHRADPHLSRARGNGRHVRDMAPSVCSPCPRSPHLVCLTQGSQQFGPQGAARQHIQPRIDGFSRQVFAHVVRIRASKSPRNLFRRASLPQMGLDVLPQPAISEFPDAPRLTGPRRRQGVRRAGPIAALSGVASHLAADGAGGSPQDHRHPPQRMASGQAQAHGFTFFGTQVVVGSGSQRNTRAELGSQCCSWG